jgi:hypothetical protein
MYSVMASVNMLGDLLGAHPMPQMGSRRSLWTAMLVQRSVIGSELVLIEAHGHARALFANVRADRAALGSSSLQSTRIVQRKRRPTSKIDS